jgi:hypothetical protein
MPKKRTQKMYFGVSQEQAVVRFLNSESEDEKNKIFNEYLREPLIIMIESIIRRYKLHRKGMEFDENHTDTMSFLITKMEKFNPDAGYKAYSYFGTICRNYLMGSMEKDSKEINRKISYEDIATNLEDNADFSYIIDEVHIDHTNIIKDMVNEIENELNTPNITENETKLGYALIEIFQNFDTIFQIGEGNKFNKNLILLSIRDMTSLNTKEIRVAMKRYKNIYGNLVNNVINQ